MSEAHIPRCPGTDVVAVAEIDGAPERERLRSAIARIKAENARIEELAAAERRAREARWAQHERHREATEELKDARRRSLAAGLIECIPQVHEIVAAAQTRIDAAQAEIDRLSEMETAIRAELAGGEGRIRWLNAQRHEAVAACIVAAPAFTALLDAIDRAWIHLRSLRICADLAMDAARGYMSAGLMSTLQRSEPLAENIVGYEVEVELVEAWRHGLAALVEDADTDITALPVSRP